MESDILFRNLAIAPLISVIVPYHVAHIINESGGYVVTLEIALILGVFLAAKTLHTWFEAKLAKLYLVQLAFLGIASSMILLAIVDQIWVWHLAMLLLGVCIILNNFTVEAVRSLAIPENQRARLQVIHQVMIQGAVPIGFYLLSFEALLTNLSELLIAYAGIFMVMALGVLFIPKMKALLTYDHDQLEGAYDRLFSPS